MTKTFKRKLKLLSVLVLVMFTMSGCIVERFACAYLDEDIIIEKTPEGHTKIPAGLYKAHVALFASEARCERLTYTDEVEIDGED